MSAKSRSRRYLELPLKAGDFITFMETMPNDDHIAIATKFGRAFVVHRVKGYKRPFKVHEITFTDGVGIHRLLT